MRYAQSVTNKFIPVMKNDKLNLWRAVYIERCKYGSGGSMVLPGCMTRLENLFNGIQEKIGFLEERLEKYRLDMEQAEAEYEKPFQYEEELKTKLARQFELNNLLDMENRKSPEAAQSPEEEKTETHNQEEQIPHVAEQPYRYGAGREENR